MVAAYLKPKVIAEFTKKYDGSQIPRDDIGMNVLAEMGVPQERTKSVFELIVKGAESLDLISDIKGKKYLNLSRNGGQPSTHFETEKSELNDVVEVVREFADPHQDSSPITKDQPPNTVAKDGRTKRVFITHGKNTDFIAPIKKLLTFGELEAVVSIEIQSVSQPVPEKVMRDMRSCGAAIIHVDGEQTLMDTDANPHQVLNPNVLIEIGAAMALYGRRFILIVREGVKLPSNLQGLYEVRYSGTALDGDATIRLMEAINKLKTEPLEKPGA